jgi:hypothetical protein
MAKQGSQPKKVISTNDYKEMFRKLGSFLYQMDELLASQVSQMAELPMPTFRTSTNKQR